MLAKQIPNSINYFCCIGFSKCKIINSRCFKEWCEIYLVFVKLLEVDPVLHLTRAAYLQPFIWFWIWGYDWIFRQTFRFFHFKVQKQGSFKGHFCCYSSFNTYIMTFSFKLKPTFSWADLLSAGNKKYKVSLNGNLLFTLRWIIQINFGQKYRMNSARGE